MSACDRTLACVVPCIVLTPCACARVTEPSVAGDQPGGEGTGKALGVNDDSLFAVFGVVIGSVFFAFAQWQDYQDDDEDFFDTYDSRRNEKQDSRNRDLQRSKEQFRGA